jgi:hypothetical protein
MKYLFVSEHRKNTKIAITEETQTFKMVFSRKFLISRYTVTAKKLARVRKLISILHTSVGMLFVAIFL